MSYKWKLILAVLMVFLLSVLSACDSSSVVERSPGYLNIIPPDEWSDSTIDKATITIEGRNTDTKDKNWGLRELEAGKYIVRISSEDYLNYGEIVEVEAGRTTKFKPDSVRDWEPVVSDVENDRFQTQDKRNILSKGINLGLAKPGSFPGDTAIRKSEYRRWIRQIGEMNANMIRVYTIHPPEFYEALADYNERNPADPIYLLHGSWIDEEELNDTNDIFDAPVTEDFDQEIKDIIDIVHGQAIIRAEPGKASGIYHRDISDYVLGFIIGIEWSPDMVAEVSGGSYFSGDYFETEGADPFEVWLAERMEKAVEYEEKTYNKQRSISFTNWVTTDAIEDKSIVDEPEESQRKASINADHIEPTVKFDAGYFASYHIYPYYPEYINRAYSSDNYAEYLSEINDEHDTPILVAEFGLPASRGKTHDGAQAGLDQGNLSEKEQGEGIIQMFEDIEDEGLMGGLIFSWQDEFFKRTWNTMDYDNDERRPYWPDIETNEQFFGLLSFDLQGPRNRYIDGQSSGWMEEDIFYQPAEDNPWEKFYVAHDEEGLQLHLEYSDSVDLSEPTYILLAVNEKLNNNNEFKNHSLERGIDFIVKLTGEDDSRVLVAEDYDRLLMDEDYKDEVKHNTYDFAPDGFNPIRLVLQKGGSQYLDFDYHESGKLKFGNGNPDSSNYNSLTDVAVQDNVLELRLPWGLMNFRDPSRREIIGSDLDSSLTTEGISLRLLEELDGAVTSFPKRQSEVKTYTWNYWNSLLYEERKKESYDMIKRYFNNL